MKNAPKLLSAFFIIFIYFAALIPKCASQYNM